MQLHQFAPGTITTSAAFALIASRQGDKRAAHATRQPARKPLWHKVNAAGRRHRKTAPEL